MDSETHQGSVAKPAADVFMRIEHLAYAAVGGLLCIAAALGLAGAAWTLWQDAHDWSGTRLIAQLIERLLFVLMLVEILHTVRASMRTGGLRAEPFLIVGIIASIRRVLVSTLEISEGTKTGAGTGGGTGAATAVLQEGGPAFRDYMIELAVLGFLILVMVISIYLLRQRGLAPTEE